MFICTVKHYPDTPDRNFLESIKFISCKNLEKSPEKTFEMERRFLSCTVAIVECFIKHSGQSQWGISLKQIFHKGKPLMVFVLLLMLQAILF